MLLRPQNSNYTVIFGENSWSLRLLFIKLQPKDKILTVIEKSSRKIIKQPTSIHQLDKILYQKPLLKLTGSSFRIKNLFVERKKTRNGFVRMFIRYYYIVGITIS